ncbi:hypothetical protein ACFLQN_02890 [Candidatus Aenigmatarchaeota archaeon]
MFGFLKNSGIAIGYRDAAEATSFVGGQTYDDLKRITALDKSDPTRQKYETQRGVLFGDGIQLFSGQDIGRTAYRWTHGDETRLAENVVAVTENAASLVNDELLDENNPLELLKHVGVPV